MILFFKNILWFFSLCFTEDVIEKCKTLGVTRTMLSLSNLDRMTKTISQNDSFKEIPVIDADQLLWVRFKCRALT